MKHFTRIFLLTAVLLPISTGSAKTINLKKFKTKAALCHYIEGEKEAAENRMKKGYKASKYINQYKMSVSVVLSVFVPRHTSQGMVIPFTRSVTTAWMQTGQPFGHLCDDLPLRYSV